MDRQRVGDRIPAYLSYVLPPLQGGIQEGCGPLVEEPRTLGGHGTLSLC